MSLHLADEVGVGATCFSDPVLLRLAAGKDVHTVSGARVLGPVAATERAVRYEKG